MGKKKDSVSKLITTHFPLEINNQSYFETLTSNRDEKVKRVDTKCEKKKELPILCE